MRWAIWPAFLALAFVSFGLLGIWDVVWVAFKTLDLIRSQMQEEPLKPPAAPSWKPRPDHFGAKWTDPLAAAGRHIRDIPFGLGVKDDVLSTGEGIAALGIDSNGDYAPLIMQNEGAVRAAGKWHDDKTGKDHWPTIRVDKQGYMMAAGKTGADWVPILVDKAGRVICSPDSFPGFNLAPGETITITGPPLEKQP